MLLPLSNRLIAHLDMNSFFATVEQQADRSLRGRPLGVCAYLGRHGCVIAASVEAKRLGAKVGMTVAAAKARIPSMAFVQADPPKYRSVIARVFRLLHGLTDRVEHYSIDEAFLDLTGWYRDDLALIGPFLEVKRRIREEIGDWLKCSVGVGPTRLLAKMASDRRKPDGFTMVSHGSVRDFLADAQLTDVCGIGERTRRRLSRANIHTALEFLDAPPPNLVRAGGLPLLLLQAGLQGRSADLVRPFSAHEAPKSVGHSYCVPRKTNRDGNVLPVFVKLIEKAGRRLRALGLEAGGIVATVGLFSQDPRQKGRFARYGEYEGLQKRFPEPVSDGLALVQAGLELLGTLWDGTEDVSFLAVTLVELSIPRAQPKLEAPAPDAAPEKRLRLSQAMDRVRDKYGDGAILLGSMAGAEHEAPDRIGFRKTVGVEAGGFPD